MAAFSRVLGDGSATACSAIENANLVCSLRVLAAALRSGLCASESRSRGSLHHRGNAWRLHRLPFPADVQSSCCRAVQHSRHSSQATKTSWLGMSMSEHHCCELKARLRSESVGGVYARTFAAWPCARSLYSSSGFSLCRYDCVDVVHTLPPEHLHPACDLLCGAQSQEPLQQQIFSKLAFVFSTTAR